MYTVTTIKEINKDGTVLVGCSTKACNGCKAEMFCNNKNDNEFLVKNDKRVPVAVGSRVEIFLPPGKTILSTVLVFALPLALFPVGYLLAKSLTGFNEILCALSGAGFMAIAFGISALISIKNKKDLMPCITKVIE